MEIKWHEPWAPIERPEEREALQAELHSELGASHPLFSVSVVALARRYDQDDVLFELPDSRVAEVHLTWSCKPERDPHFPRTTIFSSAAVWAEEKMKSPMREAQADGQRSEATRCHAQLRLRTYR
jgi:hypothetical protein